MSMLYNGERKYLTSSERNRFYKALHGYAPLIRLFALIMLETGCRISEALNLTYKQIDIEASCIYFETLKRRKKGLFRSVPISPVVLNLYKDLSDDLILQDEKKLNEFLWSWSRMTGYRYLCSIMDTAKIFGMQATPKGLRHGFAVAALETGVPLNLVQRWLGHSKLETTAIYTFVVGKEERDYAKKIWHYPDQLNTNKIISVI